MDIFSSQQSRLIALIAVQYLALLSILYNVLNYYNTNRNLTYMFIILFIVLVVNNYIRKKYLKNQSGMWFNISFAASVIIIGCFTYYFRSLGTGVYNIILLIEIIITDKKVEIINVIFTFIVYCISNIAYLDSNSFYTIENVLLNFFSALLIVFLFRNIVVEKVRVEKLNKELKEANTTLKNYSHRIEELTIEKERTRIAQELHDSIGHSLIALKMNLEYVENVLEVQPAKAKEVIKKTQSLSKDCIDNLRKAVTLLKKDSTVEKLREAINELFKNFKETNSIKLHLEMNESIETVNPDIKNCIYKTVREAVTNGIKHGNAANFYIEIFKNADRIIFKVANDGLECGNIIKSNGIKGIEERIIALGGKVSFNSEKDYRFTIEAYIPEL